ncbi:WD40 repeat-containing protein [Trichoderma longibrachiatum]
MKRARRLLTRIQVDKIEIDRGSSYRASPVRVEMLKYFRRRKSRKQKSLISTSPSPSETTLGSSLQAKRPVEIPAVTSVPRDSIVHSKNPPPKSAGLGLHVLHDPEFSTLDIIFVHGLGGHSHKTWTKDQDPLLFWPKSWLPLEPDVGTARIMTFGYNAKWRGEAGISSITDFAKELLYEMRFAKDPSEKDISIGVNPIIFVVHSMGGLVVKKAFLFGLYDDNYKDIIRSVSAIVFLSTPHRGTHLAETLNRILAVSFQSPKTFIADLEKSSTTIEDVNEQFRHFAPKLSLWSFYETLPTPIGLRKLIIVEKDSSVLGYPAEVSRPLHADHRGVCKYSSPADANYVSVRNALKSLVTTARSKAIQEAEAKEHQDLQILFRNCQSSEDDYKRLRRHWIPGTCSWFLEKPKVETWMKTGPESRILWYNAPPASGKSVLSAFIIGRLKDAGLQCQYFLFNYSDQRKRSAVGCLKALALQLARDVPEFRRMLRGSSPANLGFESAEPSLLWRNTIEKLLLSISRSDPIYWVIDALDEADSPDALLDCFRGLSKANVPIRLLILSRNTISIAAGFDRLSKSSVRVERIEQPDQLRSKQDVEIMVEEGIKQLGGSNAFKQQLTHTILARSEGNFLWTKLVLEEIRDCQTEQDIQKTLGQTPGGMIYLYQRMEGALLSTAKLANKPLIRALLEWTICAQRSLSVREMAQALSPEFSGFLDLKKTIQNTCGQFIHVGDNDTITMLHHTAREYFTSTLSSQLHIDTHETHEKLFARTLNQLEEPELRWRLIQSQHALQASEPFVFYAAANWPSHLVQSDSTSSESLDHLLCFFRGPAVLDWIHALALLRQLEVLIHASKAISLFVHRMQGQQTSNEPGLSRSSDLELLDEWAIDLVKVVGKFGSILVSEPGVIYDIIPAFCPTSSALHKQHYKPQLAKIKVLGVDDESWNDSLGRLVLPGDVQGLDIACAGNYVAALAPHGVIHIWDTSNFAEVCSISHGEYVTAMALSGSGLKLATYGVTTTKTWSVAGGELLTTTMSFPNVKARVIAIAENDEKVLVGCEDNVIRYTMCDEPDRGWRTVNPALLNEAGKVYSTNVNSPVCLSFSSDNSLVGAAYRGAPLSVWRLSDGRCLNRCRRANEPTRNLHQNSTNWSSVKRLTWNPVTNHILGIYLDGCIFKWHALTEENVEARAAADEIAASPNGKVFATSSSNGTVRIWDFASFRIIYQLSSEDLVTTLAFSPDSGRLYDVRDGTINAWEPAVLTRFLAKEEEDLSNSTNTNTVQLYKDQTKPTYVESQVLRFEPVTAFALSPDASTYCVGHEDGSAILFQRGDIEGRDFAKFHNFLDVVHIRWSSDGTLIAVADLAGEVQVKSLQRGTRGQLDITSLPAPPLVLDGNNIDDMLFSHDSKLLFISTREKGHVFYVTDGTQQSNCEYESDSPRWWLPHPSRPDLLLAFGSVDVVTYTWLGLKKLSTSVYFELQRPGLVPKTFPTATGELTGSEQFPPSDGAYSEASVTNVLLTHDAEHVLVNTKAASQRGTIRKTFIFPISAFDIGTLNIGLPSTIGHLQLPPSISSRVKVSLGVLPGARLAFLDHDAWLCTYFLHRAIHSDFLDSYDRHYFVPREWVGAISFDNCHLAKDGTLFWPRDDKVALIECNLDEPRVNYMYQA